MFYFTVSCLFTFVREGIMYVEFNSVTLFTILYSRFLNCAKDVSKVTAHPTILEYIITKYAFVDKFVALIIHATGLGENKKSVLVFRS